MGVPGIHLEQIFGPFGEKPGGPFSYLSCERGGEFAGGEEMMRKVPIFLIITGQEAIIETPQKSYIMTWKMNKRYRI